MSFPVSALPSQAKQSPHALFPSIFKPLILRGITLKNRLFFPSFGVDLAASDGCFSTSLHDFYTGIADGGCGFIVLGNASVSPTSILQPRGLRMHEAMHAEALTPFVEACARTGTVVGVQLQHYGAQGVTTHIAEKVLLSPSGVPSPAFSKLDPSYAVKSMTRSDIAAVRKQFIDAADISHRAGVRLIQLQASNGYLLSSFMSPSTNHRLDEYGGSMSNRARLLTEIIDGIRQKTGHDTILSVRLGIDDGIGDKGVQPGDFADVIPNLQRAGMDMMEVSIGTAETGFNFGRSEDMVERMVKAVRIAKSLARVPVGFAGLVGTLNEAEQLIAVGTCDFVGMGRALFADNDLITKTLSGNEASIHHCQWDGHCSKDKFNPKYSRIYCCVNPKYLRPH